MVEIRLFLFAFLVGRGKMHFINGKCNIFEYFWVVGKCILSMESAIYLNTYSPYFLLFLFSFLLQTHYRNHSLFITKVRASYIFIGERHHTYIHLGHPKSFW